MYPKGTSLLLACAIAAGLPAHSARASSNEPLPPFELRGVEPSLNAAVRPRPSGPSLGVIRLTSADSSEPGPGFSFPLGFSASGSCTTTSTAFTLQVLKNPGLDQPGEVTLGFEALGSVDLRHDLGARVSVAGIDRDSVGRMGVTSKGDGSTAINRGEGIAITVDATAMPAGSRVRISRIEVQHVDPLESLRIVNRGYTDRGLVRTVGGASFKGRADVLISKAAESVDVSGLNLLVEAGDSVQIATVYGHEIPEKQGFRLNGLTLEVSTD